MVGDRLVTAATGAAVSIPPGTPHGSPPAGAVLDEASAEQQAAFDARLRELHEERWADGVSDLLADQRR